MNRLSYGVIGVMTLVTAAVGLDANVEVPGIVNLAGQASLLRLKERIVSNRDFPTSKYYGMCIDTADIMLSKPIPVYVSTPASRFDYKTGMSIDSIIERRDSVSHFIVPFMFKGVSFGWAEVRLGENGWYPASTFSGVGGFISDLNASWPGEDGYSHALIEIIPNSRGEYFFHIPEVDSTNLTKLSSRRDTDRTRELRSILKADCKGMRWSASLSKPVYRDLTSVDSVLSARMSEGGTE